MHRSLRHCFAALLFAVSFCAHALDAGVQSKVTAKLKEVQSWAAEATVVAAVRRMLLWRR
jgi:outer membrane lipoprotein-sorting protein